MTFSEILKDIFYRDRKKIYIYLACLITVSFILFGSFIVRGEEVVGEDAATVVGGTMFSAVLILGNTMGSAIDPISILFVEGIIGLIIHFSEGSFLAPFQGKLGILENPAISIFFIVVFILVKCAKIIAPKLSMSAQEFEKIVGGIVTFVLPFLVYADAIESEAAGLEVVATKVKATTVLGFILILFVSLIMLGIYYVMRTVIQAADSIIALTISTIPLFAAVPETLKTVMCFITMFMLLNPATQIMIIILFIAMLIASIILFRKAYPVNRYYQHIYMHPLFKNQVRTAYYSDIYKNVFMDGGKNVSLFIPAFARSNINDKIPNYTYCWLAVENGRVYLCPQKKFSTSELVPLIPSQNTPYMIKKGRRFIEIFILEDPYSTQPRKWYSRPKKSFSIVISRRYSEMYDYICNATGYMRYDNTVQEDVAW